MTGLMMGLMKAESLVSHSELMIAPMMVSQMAYYLALTKDLMKDVNSALN